MSIARTRHNQCIIKWYIVFLWWFSSSYPSCQNVGSAPISDGFNVKLLEALKFTNLRYEKELEDVFRFMYSLLNTIEMLRLIVYMD